MTFEEFCELEGDQQALYVAAHRAESQMEAVMNQEAQRKAAQKSKKGK